MRNLILLALISSCASSIKEIDLPVCVEVNISKGFCTTIISGKDSIIDDQSEKTWFDSRNEMILVPIETWAALKKYLVTTCKRTKSCGPDIQTWEKSISTVDSHLQLKRKHKSDELDFPVSDSTANEANKLGK